MMSPHLLAVLRQLSHEDFLSGEAIARRLSCSRATVNNAIREALAQGVAVHAVHGRGYRLAAPLSWLDAEGLAKAFAGRGMSLRCLDQVDSTNAHLMDWAQAGAPHRSVVAAEWQSRGRGRRGRTWHAGLGQGLMFSFLWRSGRSAAQLSGLSLAVGAMLVKALRDLGLKVGGVKWPNDILVGEAKLAGVLIELSGDMLGPSAAVIGVGLNIDGGEAMSQRVGQAVTDLRRHLGAVARTDIFQALAFALDEGLAEFEAGGFSAFHAFWQAHHVHQDRSVMVISGPGDALAGIARGVDPEGALLLETPTGVRRIHSGEVSVRGVSP